MTAIWIILIIKLIAILLGLALHIASKVQMPSSKEAKKLSAVSIQLKPDSQKPTASPFPTIQPQWNRQKESDRLSVNRDQQNQITNHRSLITNIPTIPQQRIMKIKPAILQPKPADIRSLASQMAAEHNIELDGTLWIYRQVIENGGLKPYANERELEEFRENVPPHYRRKTGATPDQMASMLGYENDQQLYAAIQTEQRLHKTRPKKYTSKHFLEDAQEDLICAMNPHLAHAAD